MNTERVFAKMLKAHSNGNDVTLVTNYQNAKDIAKLIISMPNTYIEDFELSREDYDGYCDPWLLSCGEDGGIWCQKAVLENGNIAKGDGTYFIDTDAIGSYLPDDFVFGGNTKVKLIGGAN